jgi:hypothetical protein
MFRARTFVPILASVPILLACAGMEPPDREPTAAWNQQIVTELAGQLQTTTESLYNQLREAPESVTPGMENASGSMAGTAREMHEEAGELHANLASGKTMSETLNNYRRIKELSRDAGESSQFIDVAAGVGGEDSGMTSILNRLDAYYGNQ